MPRFAANLTMMFQEHAFMDRFAAAAASGFRAVEYLFPYDFDMSQIARSLQDNHLIQALFNLPPGAWPAGERGLAALPGRQTEFRQSVTTALRYAAATGVGRLHMMSGIARRDDAGACAIYRESLAYFCDHAGQAGLDVLIEPINSRDMPGYFLNDFNYAADLIADLGYANLKLQFDIYHRQIIHGDVLNGLKTLMPIIGHVQIAAVPLRHEPGTGELDDFRILSALDELSYPGFVGCEYHPAAGTADGLGWLSAFEGA
jgi:hydroxypyruvate isomerase